jgi:uncharacterized membrane protein
MATPAAAFARTFPMTSTALVPARPLTRLGLRLLRTVLVALVILAMLVLMVGPARLAARIARLPPIQLHAPRVGLVAQEPLAVQLHLTAVLIVLAIGIILLVGVKGTTLHRTLGWTWVLAMMTGAVSSLFIRMLNHGALSWIHLLSGWTIIALPMGVAFARRHKVRMHAGMMTWLFTGGLVVAGLFAFVPGRLMWRMFLG